MPSLVAAVLGRQFESHLRWLVVVSKMHMQQARRIRFSWLPCQPWLRCSRDILPRNVPMIATSTSAGGSEKLMLFSENSPDDGSSSGGSGGAERPPRPLRLMDYKKLRWPNPINSLKNYLFAALIQISFDKEFSMNSFLAGAEQAIAVVSDLVSRGHFDELEGLVTREAVQEVSHNYNSLSAMQRKFVAVNTKDIFLRFIYEIGMIFDDETQRRFVEITTVFQGLHGLDNARMQHEYQYFQHLNRDAAYVCNYRFIREYTKGKDDSWTINKLNHFQIEDMD